MSVEEKKRLRKKIEDRPSKTVSKEHSLDLRKTRGYVELMNPKALPLYNAIQKENLDQEDAIKARDLGSKYKVIVSGHVVEVYEYEKGVRVGKVEKEESPLLIDEETGEIINRELLSDPLESKKQNARRAKNELRRLLISNFDRGSKFITLTFRDGSVNDVTSVDECNNAFKKFIQRMRRKYGDDFKYACVIEFQDTNGRGAVHYHLIVDLGYVKFDDLAEVWGNGYIGINRIDHVDNIGAYVTKYMTKDFSDLRLCGKKAYFTSKNLTRPIVLQDQEAIEIIDKYLVDKKEVYANSYDSEFQGKISYKEYNMQRGE